MSSRAMHWLFRNVSRTISLFPVSCNLSPLLTAAIFVCFLQTLQAVAQSELATVFGRVTDSSGAVIVGAEVEAKNVETNTSSIRRTNNDGLYNIPSLHPGHYLINVRSQGFKTVTLTELELNVQDNVARNFVLQVGSASESVTVTADQENINTTDATVSTVIDRNFAENLPMNGRSFQSLIQLTPGAVLTTSNYEDGGQFSVNGQRPASNYWMVDGVSANIGIGVTTTAIAGNGLGGALGSFSALGGTNSLVSVDAMQEFRIQTSTFAPEFGRTPGGQISIATRSGTNQFHGTAFDYLRNDVLDASNWFNGYTNTPALQKAKERQNDFGGTLSGPVFRNKTFFFFSYEGLRLRLPQTALTKVPDLPTRQSATPAMQPFLNAFPFDPNQPNLGGGVAQLNASYSDPAALDAFSLRVDHQLGRHLTLFGRYNYSPSAISQRGTSGNALSSVDRTTVNTRTATIGATWTGSGSIANDFRLNFSQTRSSSAYSLDNFDGAKPLALAPFPSPLTFGDGLLYFRIISLQAGQYHVGPLGKNRQEQYNVVDGLSLRVGSHNLKLGVDYRRLSPLYDPYHYIQVPIFRNVASAASGTPLGAIIGSNVNSTFLFRNLGLYAQDTWHISPRLTLTYGLRWDLDFTPTALDGPNFLAVANSDFSNLSNLSIAPAGTPPYAMTYGNVAPRFGVAYQLSADQRWQTVVRGGFGVFYDLASSEAGNQLGAFPYYPFGSQATRVGSPYPLTSTAASPPAIAAPDPTNRGLFYGFDPHLQLPYTLEWNVSLEQVLAKEQTLSLSYVGAVGQRLLQTEFINAPNPTFTWAQLVTNAGTSGYHALQLQFQRHLSRGLQAVTSYTWAHAIDTASAGSVAVGSNLFSPGVSSNSSRGSADFDIRHSLSAALLYDLPHFESNRLINAIVRGWSVQNTIQARSAPPVDVSDAHFSQFLGGIRGDVRPDLVTGQSVFLYGSQYPGGKAINPAAFVDPPSDPKTFLPLRQGDTPRNALRGFGAVQWDFAVHRDFPLRESVKLQFRTEMFNVLNHPNFGSPSAQFGLGGFGLSNQMLGQSLNNGNLGGGGFSPLYQIGGPRSIQLALKLLF